MVRNWRVDCPRLHKLCVQLETHFGHTKNRDRLRSDLADAHEQYVAAKKQDSQRLEALREYCETKLALDSQLCDEDGQPDDNHQWHVHAWAESLGEVESKGQPAKSVRRFISGWVPRELLDAAPGFVLSLPPEKADGIRRSLTQSEKSVALAVIHDVTASDPIVDENHALSNWHSYSLAVEQTRKYADDSWAPKLGMWAKGIGVSEQPEGVMSAILDLLRGWAEKLGLEVGAGHRDMVRAHREKLFPNGLPDDQDLIDAIVKLDTERGNGITDKAILLDFTKEQSNSCPKVEKLQGRIRKARQSGKTTLPPCS